MRVSNVFIVASIIALAIIILTLGIAWRLRNSAFNTIRQQLIQQAESGNLPDELKGIDWNTAAMEDFETEVEPEVLIKVEIADAVQSLWFIWVPLVLVLCFGVAYLVTH